MSNGLFSWMNRPMGQAPAAATNPATAAGAVTTGATAAPGGLTGGVGYQAPTVGAGVGGQQGVGGMQYGGGGGGMTNGQMLIGGVTALGNLWNAYQQNKLAKDQFKFQKNAYNTSLNDNRQTYNSALEDRIRSRYNTEGRSSQEADSYLDNNRLGG